jgi:hypothetical protein
VGGCKSHTKAETKAEAPVVYPKPATETQTDSLKLMLDWQRDEQLKNK